MYFDNFGNTRECIIEGLLPTTNKEDRLIISLGEHLIEVRESCYVSPWVEECANCVILMQPRENCEELHESPKHQVFEDSDKVPIDMFDGFGKKYTKIPIPNYIITKYINKNIRLKPYDTDDSINWDQNLSHFTKYGFQPDQKVAIKLANLFQSQIHEPLFSPEIIERFGIGLLIEYILDRRVRESNDTKTPAEIEIPIR